MSYGVNPGPLRGGPLLPTSAAYSGAIVLNWDASGKEADRDKYVGKAPEFKFLALDAKPATLYIKRSQPGEFPIVWDSLSTQFFADINVDNAAFDALMRRWWVSLPTQPDGIGPNAAWRNGYQLAWTSPYNPAFSLDSPAGRRVTLRLIRDALPISPDGLIAGEPWLNGDTISFVPGGNAPPPNPEIPTVIANQLAAMQSIIDDLMGRISELTGKEFT